MTSPPPEVPPSVRHAWHRISLLGTLVVVLALPWLTSTGCSGDQPPTTHTGYQLFADSLRGDALFALAPAGLVLAALVGVLAPRVRRAGRRLGLTLALLVVVTSASLALLVAIEGPRVGDVVTHHFASFAGTGALAALVLDAFVRAILGVREAWLARRRHASGASTGGVSVGGPLGSTNSH